MKQTLYKTHHEFSGLSGSTLKMIAAVTMLIDHFAAGVLGRYLSMAGAASLDMNNTAAVDQWMKQNMTLYSTYYAMRMVGRMAFPIYCFLLVEGFQHTKDLKKYMNRLLCFAAFSEIPFDLLFNETVLEFDYQNVFFTLFFGMLVMAGLQWTGTHAASLGRIRTAALNMAVIAGGMFVAEFSQADYGAVGVICITALYLFRRKKIYQILAGFITFFWEMTALLAFIPIWFYNGRRGWNGKYFFYLFYPVHLLLLYLLCVALGITSYASM